MGRNTNRGIIETRVWSLTGLNKVLGYIFEVTTPNLLRGDVQEGHHAFESRGIRRLRPIEGLDLAITG
jgi:hypothetical protein